MMIMCQQISQKNPDVAQHLVCSDNVDWYNQTFQSVRTSVFSNAGCTDTDLNVLHHCTRSSHAGVGGAVA